MIDEPIKQSAGVAPVASAPSEAMENILQQHRASTEALFRAAVQSAEQQAGQPAPTMQIGPAEISAVDMYNEYVQANSHPALPTFPIPDREDAKD